MSEHRQLTAGEVRILLKVKADAERVLGSAGIQRAIQQGREEVASLLETAEDDSETVRRDIPHEPGCWMRFRRLTTTELEEAKAEVRRKSHYDGPSGELYFPPPSLDGYDKGFLTRLGIVAWGGVHYSEPCSPELTGELDLRTYEWAARQVLDVSVPRQGRPLSGADGLCARAHRMRAHEGYDNDDVAQELYPDFYADGRTETLRRASAAASKGRRRCPECGNNSDS